MIEDYTERSNKRDHWLQVVTTRPINIVFKNLYPPGYPRILFHAIPFRDDHPLYLRMIEHYTERSIKRDHWPGGPSGLMNVRFQKLYIRLDIQNFFMPFPFEIIHHFIY